MRTSRKSGLAALALALPLALAACSDDEPQGTAGASSTPSPGASPEVAISTLEGLMTELTVDQGFADALGRLGVTAGFLGSATTEDATATFPITGGSVSYFDPATGVRPFVDGSIEHEGSGISLAAGGSRLELEDFVVDPDSSVLTGTVSSGPDGGSTVADSANLFFLDGRSLEPLQVEGGTAVLEGAQVKLHPDAAQMLRNTFGTEEIPDYLPVGTSRITLSLPQGAAGEG